MLTIMQIIAWTLKMILRILLIPVVLILTILYWVGTVIVAFSTWVLDLIGGLFIMTGLLSFGFGFFLFLSVFSFSSKMALCDPSSMRFVSVFHEDSFFNFI